MQCKTWYSGNILSSWVGGTHGNTTGLTCILLNICVVSCIVGYFIMRVYLVTVSWWMAICDMTPMDIFSFTTCYQQQASALAKLECFPAVLSHHLAFSFSSLSGIPSFILSSWPIGMVSILQGPVQILPPPWNFFSAPQPALSDLCSKPL